MESTPAQLEIERLTALGVDISAIAEAVGVSRRTVFRWRDDGDSPHPTFFERLRNLKIESTAAVAAA